MHAHDAPADPACFGIPTHLIADFEYPRHHDSPKTRTTMSGCVGGWGIVSFSSCFSYFIV
jgi:hypothetical protein